MDFRKKILANLELCYCVAPLVYRGEQHYLVASEKEFPCLLFDSNGNVVEKVWDGPGGTMTIVQPEGTDGFFLATQKFYSPNNSKEAYLVAAKRESGGWRIHPFALLPFVHRFDVLSRNGSRYILACCLKSGHEYKDDWRFPGFTCYTRMPENPEDLLEEKLEFKVLQTDMLKNHGYTRNVHEGVDTGIVSCDSGVYRYTPPETPDGEWQIEKLIEDPASDALFVDFEGHGEEELVVISPFHGDTLSIYRSVDGKYSKVWEYERKTEFAHAITAFSDERGKNYAVIGHRKGRQNILAITKRDGEYGISLIDTFAGSANIIPAVIDGKKALLSANREINEIACYSLVEE